MNEVRITIPGWPVPKIVNRVLSDGWAQSIRVILEDIELTGENLLELKQFKPNGQVLVELSPAQVNLLDFDAIEQAAAGTEQNSQDLLGSDSLCVEEKEFMDLTEGDEPLGVHEKVEMEWKFDAG